MFSAIKKFFRRKPAMEACSYTPEIKPDAPATVAPARTAYVPVPRVALQPPAAKVSSALIIALPLKSVLGRLTPDLMRQVRLLDVGDATVSLPIPKIVPQIPRGSVKFTFAELREASPPGVFAEGGTLDETLVEIPLNEIISRLDPAFLAKRPAQQQVVVPTDIAGPFDENGGSALAVVSPKPSKAAPAPSEAVTPAPSAPVAKPVARVRSNPAVTPLAPTAPGMSPAIARAQPVLPIASSMPAKSFETSTFKRNVAPTAAPATLQAPLTDHNVSNRVANPAPVETAFRVYTPIDPNPVSTATPAGISMGEFSRTGTIAMPITPIAPDPVEAPQPIRFQTAPAPAPVIAPAPEPLAAPVADGRCLTVTLAELSADWPQSIQSELVSFKPSKTMVRLPVAMVEVAIKQGKVSLPWRVVRGWVQPAGIVNASANDSVVLELPLKVITPLFLAEMKSVKPQRKIVIDANIPDLFNHGSVSEQATVTANPTAVGAAEALAATPVKVSSSLPAFTPVAAAPAPVVLPVQSSAPAAVARKVADTNYFVKEALAAASVETEPLLKQGGSLSTAFLNRYATPNEIVGKAMALEGVEGALVALPDGLLVASQIPSTMNADTIAAFLPQLFAKVSQCTRELRLGDLNNINFTVGLMSWKIYKVGAIYFAAFGRPGEPLPTAELTQVAGELDRSAR